MATEGAPKPEIYNYDTPEGLEEYKYATNVVVSNTNREFFISFTCLRPYERNRCVSRVVVGEEHLAEIITVLQAQLSKFRQQKSSGGLEGGLFQR